MKDLALFGGLALAGYLLFRNFQQNNSVVGQASNTPTTSYYPTGYITPSDRQQLIRVASEPTMFGNQYINSGGYLIWEAWSQCYREVFGFPVPVIPLDVHSPGDAHSVTMTVDDFTNMVNGQLVQTSGLGMLAIPGNIGIGLQNHRLPANLELFNALLH